ncbi:class I SAM-dependent methyltransferase [Candidatus Parcubacteria bacterium]|nr:class I SAM-dependent methyltransferase [Candidatus Parcubacteria bacterium]
MQQVRKILYNLKEWWKIMFVYPPLTLSNVDYDEYWKSKRGSNIGAISDWQIERASFVINELKERSVGSICDIACGDGSILHYISKQFPGVKLVGTDISEFALEQAEKFGVETIKLDIGDTKQLTKIPVADYILLFEILEHIPHSEELLLKAYEKSERGVFFSFPNTGFFPHRLRLLFGRVPMQWKLSPSEHVRFWTKRDLLWWLQSLGFKKYKIKYYKGVPFLNELIPSWFAAGFVVFISK